RVTPADSAWPLTLMWSRFMLRVERQGPTPSSPGREAKVGRVSALACTVVVALVWTLNAGLAGATPPERAEGGTKPPPDYRTVTVKKAGFTIAVPKRWVTLDPTSKGLQGQLKRLRKRNPELAKTALSPDALAQGAKTSVLFMLDTAGETFHANVHVALVRDAVSPPSQDDIRGELNGEGFPEVETNMTNVADVEAVEAASQQDVNYAQGTLTLHMTVYALLGDKGGIAIIFTGLDDGRQDPTVQTMIQSLKLLR